MCSELNIETSETTFQTCETLLSHRRCFLSPLRGSKIRASQRRTHTHSHTFYTNCAHRTAHRAHVSNEVSTITQTLEDHKQATWQQRKCPHRKLRLNHPCRKILLVQKYMAKEKNAFTNYIYVGLRNDGSDVSRF